MAALIALQGCGVDGSDKNKRQQESIAVPKESSSDHVSSGGKNTQTSSSTVTLNDLHKRMRANFALKPDRRFLFALGDIKTILVGVPFSPATAKFNGHGWTITHEGENIGSVPQLPEFEELYNLQLSWAKNLSSKANQAINKSAGSNKVNALSHEASPRKLFESLKSLNDRWKHAEHNTATLKEAARQIILLCQTDLDLMGVADGLFARAIALSCISEQSSTEIDYVNRCMLANMMGYFNYAKAHVSKLPSEEPLRLFITNNDAKLREFAATGGISAYYYLNQMARQRKDKAWHSFVETKDFSKFDITLPALTTFDEMIAEDSAAPFAQLLIVASQRTVVDPEATKKLSLNTLSWSYSQVQDSTEWIISDLFSAFEHDLELQKAPSEGVFYNQQIVESYYQSIFLSGLFRLTESYIQLPSAGETLERLANSARSKKAVSVFEQWLRTRIALRVKPETIDISSSIKDQHALGPRPIMSLFRDLGAFYETPDAVSLLRLGEPLFSVLDSRPDTRIPLSAIAESSLLYPGVSRFLLDSAKTAGGSTSLKSEIQDALKTRDSAGLWAALRMPISPTERKQIISALAGLESSNLEQVTKEYAKAFAISDRSWNSLQPYLRFLKTTKQLKSMSTVLEAYLKEKRTFKFLEEAQARTALADTLYDLKEFKQGLTALGNACKTEQFPPLAAKVRLLEGMARKDDAEAWAKETFGRFEHAPEAITLLAEILWRNGKYSEAAKLIASHRNYLSGRVWTIEIAPAFLEAFDKNNGGMQLALGSMKDAGIDGPDTIGEIAHLAYANDMPQQAFEILANVQAPADQAADLFTCGYRYLKRWKSEKDALSWLSQKVAQKDRYRIAPYAFLSGQNELLWDFIKPLPQESADSIWILRTAASLLSDPKTKDHRKLLENHFAKDKSAWSKVGKFMLGNSNDLPDTKDLPVPLQSSAAFYCGWRYMTSQSEFLPGAELLRLSVVSDQSGVPESMWAMRWLSDIGLTLMHHPADLDKAHYSKLRIVGPQQAGRWDKQRRFSLKIR